MKQRVQIEMERFLSRKYPQAMCVSGSWGVGKTYLWSDIVLPMADDLSKISSDDSQALGHEIDYNDYSYVSLFGINSLAELKRAIFESKLPRKNWKRSLSVEDVKANWLSRWKPIVRSKPSAIEMIGAVLDRGDAAEMISAQLSNSTWNQIVCIDDLERRGKDLSLRDVLGYVSFLKEQRRCKVLVLTNSGDFDADEKSQYENLSENVFDITLVFAPSPVECADIIQADGRLREKLLALNISNIRIARRTKSFVEEALRHLSDYEQSVSHQALDTLVLLSWIKFSKDAPPMSFLAERHTLQFLEERIDHEPDEKQANWNAIIQAYGFGEIDFFDAVLVRFVNDGFVDIGALKKAAEQLNRTAQAQAQGERRAQVWRTIADSFQPNEATVVDDLVAVYRETMGTVYAQQLSRTVRFLRFMRKDQLANELIDLYIATHKGNNIAFDLKRQSEYAEPIDDPILVELLTEEFRNAPVEGTPAEALLRSIEYGKNSDEDLQFASSITEADIVVELQTRSGTEFRDFVRACFHGRGISNPRTGQLAIADKTKRAIQSLAQQNRLNQYRARLLGIPDADAGSQRDEH